MIFYLHHSNYSTRLDYWIVRTYILLTLKMTGVERDNPHGANISMGNIHIERESKNSPPSNLNWEHCFAFSGTSTEQLVSKFSNNKGG